MKVTIDFDRKIIEVNNDGIKLGDLVKQLCKMVDSGEWKDFLVKAKGCPSYPCCPYYPYYYPYYPTTTWYNGNTEEGTAK